MFNKLISKIIYSSEINKKVEQLNFLINHGKISSNNFEELIKNGLDPKVVACWNFLYLKDHQKMKLEDLKDDSLDDETREDIEVTSRLSDFVKDLRKSNQGLVE